MKKYQLIGTIWDKKKNKLFRSPEIITEKELGYCEDYQTEYNLFDVHNIRRKINFSALLRCEKEHDRLAVVSHLKACNAVYLVVDFLPRNFNCILWRFYVKTLLQCYSFICNIKEDVCVTLVVNRGTASEKLLYMQRYCKTYCV